MIQPAPVSAVELSTDWADLARQVLAGYKLTEEDALGILQAPRFSSTF
jgi:hypothetical protein